MLEELKKRVFEQNIALVLKLQQSIQILFLLKSAKVLEFLHKQCFQKVLL